MTRCDAAAVCHFWKPPCNACRKHAISVHMAEVSVRGRVRTSLWTGADVPHLPRGRPMRQAAAFRSTSAGPAARVPPPVARAAHPGAVRRNLLLRRARLEGRANWNLRPASVAQGSQINDAPRAGGG